MFRLALFDIDGTLIRSGGAGVRAFKEAFGRVFAAPQAVENLSFAGRTDTSLLREALAGIGLAANPADTARFFAAYTALLQEKLGAVSGEVCPGVHDWISDLSALPDPPALGLLTGNIRRGAELKLSHYGLWHRFAFGAYADDHEDRNQIAAAAHRRGSEFLGQTLSGSQALVIGDTPHDITCARSIGAKVLAVATGSHSMADLSRHQPDWLAADLREIRPSQIWI